MIRMRRSAARAGEDATPARAALPTRLPVSRPGGGAEQRGGAVGGGAGAGAQFTFSRIGVHPPTATDGADDALHARLQHRSGRGSPLPLPARASMEPRFGGADFSKVRIHADAEAAQLTRVLGAEAFTFGRDIYAPAGLGRGLLAHELAHTLQQESSRPQIHRSCHTVAAKETLTSIGSTYGVSATAVAEANDLTKSAVLPVGTFLIIPDGKACHHTVASGETLYHIAQTYKASVDAIKAANGLTSDAIKAGDVLNIPVDDATAYTTYTVAPSDTLFSLAKTNGVTVEDIKALNGLKSDAISEGQQLNIPKAKPAAATPTPTTATTPATSTSTLPPGNPSASAATATPKTTSTPTVTTTMPPTPKAAAVAASSSTDPGHNPTKDYTSGTMRERSYLRAADKVTKLQSGKSDLYFENGATVKLVSASGNWVEVEGEAFSKPAKPASAGKVKGWVERAWTSMTLGDYKDVPVEDLTQTYGKLSSGSLAKTAVNNVILHQTGSPTGAPTLADYKKRIAKGSTIGAHYLIDESGSIKLVVPVNQKVSHVGKTKPGFETAGNANAIGIEHAGKPLQLDLPSSATDAVTLTANRAAISSFAMAPSLKARVTGMTDKELYALARANGDAKAGKWFIYGDLNAKQKRSSYLLATRLMSDFNLDEGDFLPHETASWKTIGEGEKIKEFLTARVAYRELVKKLSDTISADPKLTADAALGTLLTKEQDLVAALAKDATESENKDLAAEKAAKKPGAASAREDARTKFYEKFWVRAAQLADLLAFLKASGSSKPADLAKKIAAWKQ